MAQLNGMFRSFFGAVAVPILDKGDGTISNVTHDWANATAGLSGGLAITIMRLQIRNYRVDVAKERLCELALQNNCKFVLLIDDDVLPPHDGLMKMIKLWKSDPKYKIISGVYWSKSDPPMPLLFQGDLEGSFWDWKMGDLIKADGAGAGFLFIDTDILKKIPKPWFSCDYMYDDPRGAIDLRKWEVNEMLGGELFKGDQCNPDLVKQYEDELKDLARQAKEAFEQGKFNPNFLINKRADLNTTEDLFFFKKAKEYGYELWVDTSIQCGHQDKRTGMVWGINPSMAQFHQRYEGRYKAGDSVVLDIGSGYSPYYLEESAKPIRIDLDPAVKPDIIADARHLTMIDDCFADYVYSSHMLEHVSFRDVVGTLKEWVRVLKRGGKLKIIVPNLKWASKNILADVQDIDSAERSMFMYFSAQQGNTIAEASNDVHRSGFTMQSLQGLLARIPELRDIQVKTSEGNWGNWDRPEMLGEGDMGYNLVAIATKAYHNAPVSLKASIKNLEEKRHHIGPEATLRPEDQKKDEQKTEKKTVQKDEKANIYRQGALSPEPGTECCDNGKFGDKHICQKQPSKITETAPKVSTSTHKKTAEQLGKTAPVAKQRSDAVVKSAVKGETK